MSQRLHQTRLIWCFLIVYSGPIWRPANSVTVRTPPKNPTTIEAQAKFFQDFFSVQLSPYKIEFGHVCEDPNTWEQRYEKKDYKNHRDMGKVRWGDKKGGYGEHYWDLNHAGYADNHGDDGYDDDGSYHEDSNDTFDEPSEESPNYHTEEYNPEETPKEANRAKRANRHTVHTQRREMYEDEQTPRKTSKNKEQYKQEDVVENEKEWERNYNRPVNREIINREREEIDEKRYKRPIARETTTTTTEKTLKPKEKNNIVLVIDHKENKQPEVTTKASTTTEATENKRFVPYEGGAGVRQHYHPEAAVSASAPRLFLEPSTGHIVDRSTGQAYVLQPVNLHYN